MAGYRRATMFLAIAAAAGGIPQTSAPLLAQTDPSKVEAASSQVTPWKPVGQSMGALLNQGYRIVSHSFGFDWQEARSMQFAATLLTSKEYSFILTNGKDTVICIISSPTPNNGQSRCRKLN